MPLTRVMPGVYADGDGTMHLDIPELLTECGFPVTRANVERFAAVAREHLSRRYPDTTVVENAPLLTEAMKRAAH